VASAWIGRRRDEGDFRVQELSSVPLRFAALVFACVFSVFATPAVAAPQAAFVMNVATGEIIYQSNPDVSTSPASLAKMMTLYLTFEALEQGKLKLSEPMKVTQRAASQPPSKLGLIPGQTLTVEDAIRGLVTKSASPSQRTTPPWCFRRRSVAPRKALR
jgi:D-alanyl-D-alanine carboxypeptidase